MIERLPVSWGIGIRNLKRRKVRSALTLIGIISAIMAFVVVASITTALAEWTGSRESGTRNNGVILRYRPERLPGAVGDITVWIDEEVLEKLKKVEGVDDFIVEFKWGRSVGIISMRAKGITKTASAVFASDFEKEDKYFRLSGCLISGNLSNLDDSSIILSDWLAEGLKVGIHDTILVGGNTPYKELEVVGIFSAEKLEELRDLRGETLAPGSKNLNTGRWNYYPNQTVFLSFENAFEFTKKDSLYTDVVLMVQNQNLEKVVPEVLSIGDTGEVYPLRVIEINDGKVIEHVSYESLKIARIGPIIIVVMISALMILNTMLASMYERVREIETLSSVGANPTNVGKLFLTESSILGLVGGLAGYILGILILFIGSSVSSGTVSQKFTLNWFVGSVLLSLIVSISSAAYPASKASFLVVPSLRRSWKPSTMELIKGGEKYKVEEEEQPIVLAPDEFEEFIHHIKEKMDRPVFYDLDDFYGHTKKEGDITKFIFGFLATPVGAPVKADVEIVGKFEKGEEVGKVYLTVKPWVTGSFGGSYSDAAKGLPKYAYDITDEIRKVILEWRVQKKRFRVLREDLEKGT